MWITLKYYLTSVEGNNNISSEGALKLLKAAEAKSQELGVKMNIAVVDSGANLVGFLRSEQHMIYEDEYEDWSPWIITDVCITDWNEKSLDKSCFS